ncbi:MAG TPA: Type 1 glutamine amidotransferase-like domain-containing protein [Candidatus Angelobacter sp.]
MIKPMYLLADSQILFWKDQDRLFIEKIREQLDSPNPTAAYLGASNGDAPEFYRLFQAAMEGIGLHSCRMIPSIPSEEDTKFLAAADLVLLAGGDVERGWNAFQNHGIKDMIVQKRYDGTVLIGVSAGAVQLGLGALLESSTMRKLLLFQFAPFYVGAHEEEAEWWDLRALVNLAGDSARGIGIPAGGGMIYSPDGSLEPVRKALTEFQRQGDKMTENLLLPESAD